MNKKVQVTFFIVLIAVTSFVMGVMAEGKIRSISAYIDSSLRVTFNNELFQPKESDGTVIPPILYNNRTYLPVRAVAELLKIDVTYNSKTNTVELSNIVQSTDVSTNDRNKTVTGNTVVVSGISVPQLNEGVVKSSNIAPDGKAVPGFNVKVNRTQIPENIRNFKKISVCGIDNLSEETIIKIIEDTQMYHYGLQDYDDSKGYNSDNHTKYNIVILFDSNIDPLGYYIIK